MTTDQFRAALAGLGISQAGFARIAMVDARTVRRWCDGTRAVPGPVVALLRLMTETVDEHREIDSDVWDKCAYDPPDGLDQVEAESNLEKMTAVAPDGDFTIDRAAAEFWPTKTT